MRRSLLLIAFVCARTANAQPLHGDRVLTQADTLRGNIGADRAWWDVTHYDVSVTPDFATRSIEGTTIITFRTLASGQLLQIDLQQPLEVYSVLWGERYFALEMTREGNVLWIDFPERLQPGRTVTLIINYHGVPREAKNPPWDGGWVWQHDEQGNPWMSVACQGLGASVWYPCKDTQSDEPDSASLHITVPDSLQAIGNGRLRSRTTNPRTSPGQQQTTWNWAVVNPINNYDLIPYIGKYTHFGEVYQGVNGPLDCDYWVLKENEATAREQFKQVPSMLKCFEDWFGPYPFYKDSYKLVEAPYLGMEHQSATAYGNHFQNGYLGRDLSGSGWGLKWDYIIVHESGHEWFGNSITTADIADMWVHEGFTDYAETIYTQCQFGDAAGDDYVIGLRKNIRNDKPIVGPYGVNQEGSTDMYYKGANMLHTIRHIIGDSTFKAMLLEMNRRFYHTVTTSAEVETFISEFSHRDFSKVFDQYLRTTQVPVLEWGVKKKRVWVRWNNCVKNFSMLVDFQYGQGRYTIQQVGTDWQLADPGRVMDPKLIVNTNFYVREERVAANKFKRVK